MKIKYEKPTIEVVTISEEEILTASGGVGPQIGGDAPAGVDFD